MTLDSNSILNFQPMPKQFMVYQYNEKIGWNEVKACEGHELCIGLDGRLRVSGAARDTAVIEFLLNNSEIRIVQSTNLFDKDGKEIFEGSILLGRDDRLSVVQYDGDEGMFRTRCGNVLEDMMCGGDYFENIGHILSNPELLEE